MAKSISLGILTKNAEDSIEPLLEQCAKYAHEIIIVDSFSNDKTVDIAKKYNARVLTVAFNGSFSKLRNILLNVAKGDYLLMLDTDETLEDVHKFFNADYKDVAYSLPRYNYIDYKESFESYPDYQTRLIKLNSGVTYHNDIHEVVNVNATPLDIHIIHDKHNHNASHNFYVALKSYSKFKHTGWLEIVDIMNTTEATGWYPPEVFANGDMAIWTSSNSKMLVECHDTAAQYMEFRISTFGVYEKILVELTNYDDSVINSIEVTGAGVYKIPFNPNVLINSTGYIKIKGINKIKDIGDPRDLCAFFDYIIFGAEYKDGYMKMLWDESRKFYMKGFTYDVAIMECIIHSGWWETDNLSIIKRFVDKSSVCLDIGANIGSLTIPMSECAKKVYAFEAGPDIYGMLKSNIVANDIKNVEVLNLAVSNKKDVVYFHHNKGNVGGSYVTTNTDVYTTTAVDAIRLDTWAKQELQRLDFIKCDIEAFEVKFLKGARQTLKKYKPVMLIEFNPIAFTNNKSDDSIEDLWNELNSLYEYIYVVEGANVFRRVNSLTEACQRIDGTTRTLEDLLCTHESVE